MINWKVRLKNLNFWLAAVPAVLLVLQSAAALAGVTLPVQGVQDKLLDLINAVFGLLAWCVWRYERNPRRRIALMCLFALVIVMVGISRIYLGVHYASDVLGGFCVSTIWLVLYTKVIAPALGLIE